ncbi:DEAD/DEAH box helicase [Nocardia sp. NPDC050697]|uniref:DEAD/DEAH box helicase n=1 Tax=Nocardia sp. NPDC050697 TaxID=3155158 RepID=UPI0033E84650
MAGEQGAYDDVAAWSAQAAAIRARRERIGACGRDALGALHRRVVVVRRDRRAAWRIVPLGAGDGRRLADIARAAQLAELPAGAERQLDRLLGEVERALRNRRALYGLRRLWSGGQKRRDAERAELFLTAFRAEQSGIPELLERLTRQTDRQADEVALRDALADRVGFAAGSAELGDSPALVDADTLRELPGAVHALVAGAREAERLRAAAKAAGERLRDRAARRVLADLPLDRLRAATTGKIRTAPLEQAGIRTVLQALDADSRLEQLPGIGATTATRIRGAARTLWQSARDDTPLRLDGKDRGPEPTELVRRLRALDLHRGATGGAADTAAEFLPLARALDRRVTHLAVFGVGQRTVTEFQEAAAGLLRRDPARTAPPATADPWDDFTARPADYLALLDELGLRPEDEQRGDLPDDIVRAIRATRLDTTYLSAALRGYQSFGARFALVQRKVLIGDEMGLGKTVEALAVLAHLRALGEKHALVICPAAVVTNWVREIIGKSSLVPYRVHGQGRAEAGLAWQRGGGVAVTTFETLEWLATAFDTMPAPACVVVDEAHYIKNPGTQRAQRTARLLNAAERAVLLTGTPLENRLSEFRTLIGYLRPDLLPGAPDGGAARFRRQVAPAYLRRNQREVLDELPDLVEVDEWLPLSDADAAAYREAVRAGNFAAMRRAAFRSGPDSGKLRRLLELVDEAAANGRRVLVFSFFRDVLEDTVRALSAKNVVGPLNGSVPPQARQRMIDDFSATARDAVLVAQIGAGGVGLNIQAASVVILCEPQLKPTAEWQAIARAHRMGQLESVQVYRLLSEEGVDKRIVELLARKRVLFEEFARVSATAASAPEALDISEAEIARQVVAAERERLFPE